MRAIAVGHIYRSRDEAVADLRPGCRVVFVDQYPDAGHTVEVTEQMTLTEEPVKSGAPEYLWLSGHFVGKGVHAAPWRYPVRYSSITVVVYPE